MIKRIISERNAGLAMLVLFSLILVFHLLVLSGIVPYDISWGGRLKNREEMLVFESVSILLNTFMMIVVAIRSKILSIAINRKVITGILWGMTVLFAVNTVGNLFAVNSWETIIFTPITLVLSLFSLRLTFANN